jgi:chromosome segregation ATPase
MMTYFKAKVKKYEKKYKKRSKTGKMKDAVTVQYSIPLVKDNPFKDEDYVYILKDIELEHLDKVRSSYNKNKMKQELETLNTDNQELQDFNDKLMQEKADLQSERDMIQHQLNDQKQKVQELSGRNEDLQKKIDNFREKLADKDSRINTLNEHQKKALRDINNLENELKGYSEAKGQLNALMQTFQSKGRFKRWIAGLDTDIKILEGSIKMLSGKVQSNEPADDK